VLGLTLRERQLAIGPQPLLELAASIRDELVAAEIQLGSLQETPAGLEAKDLVDLLVSVRTELRAAREYQMADSIRAKLSEMGIVLEDGPDGSTWRVLSSP